MIQGIRRQGLESTRVEFSYEVVLDSCVASATLNPLVQSLILGARVVDLAWEIVQSWPLFPSAAPPQSNSTARG
jgi:multisubunit Na+/H+ antiporter MnhC subunit